MRGQGSEVTSREVTTTSPSPLVPLLACQHLGELGLLDLQVVQAALELADPCGVYRQVLVDLRGRRPQNHVWVGLWPLILDYKLGHSCQCKHLGWADGKSVSTAAEPITQLFAPLFRKQVLKGLDLKICSLWCHKGQKDPLLIPHCASTVFVCFFILLETRYWK